MAPDMPASGKTLKAFSSLLASLQAPAAAQAHAVSNAGLAGSPRRRARPSYDWSQCQTQQAVAQGCNNDTIVDPLGMSDFSRHPGPIRGTDIRGRCGSTYLQPLGDRLLALGIETNRTTVSLFDVANPAKPALLKPRGAGSGWSWSEANNDEKAFSVFSRGRHDSGAIPKLEHERYLTEVQLIDFATNSLSLRAQSISNLNRVAPPPTRIESSSISGREYLSGGFYGSGSSARGRNPRSGLAVDRVFLHGDYLIELPPPAAGVGGDGLVKPRPPGIASNARGRSGPCSSALTLTNLPIIGVAQSGNYLYVAQGPRSTGGPCAGRRQFILERRGDGSPFVLTTVALDNLPRLSVTGQTRIQSDTFSWGGDLQAVWPRPMFLVWAGAMSSWVVVAAADRLVWSGWIASLAMVRRNDGELGGV